MKSPQLTAIECNNNAAFLLQGGNKYNSNIKAAIAILKAALKSAQQVMNCPNQAHDTCNETSSLNQCVMKAMTIRSEVHETLDKCNGKGACIFWHPIYMPKSMASSESEPHSKISAIIIFNLALAHQMKAMKCGTSINHYSTLRKAAQLYELAYGMQKIVVENMLFVMTIINNMGSIYQILDEKIKAEKCFLDLLSNFMLAIDIGHGHIVSNFDDGVFFCSTSHLMSKSVATGAA